MDLRERLNVDDMTAEEFDALPFGAIVIRTDGTITRYNQVEARVAHLEPSRVVGKNFFRHVAPCTAVRAFEGRLRTFALSGKRISESFDYRFTFAHGDVEVRIGFARLPGGESYLIAVERID